MWKGDFEGMRRHLHLQDWDLMLVGDIETKWLRFKAVLLDLVENFYPLARSKRPLAKPWLSKKWLAKNSCLHVTKSTGPATNTMIGFTPSLCGVPVQFTNRTSSRLPSVTLKVLNRYVREGTKKRDPIPGLRRPDGSIATNGAKKACILSCGAFLQDSRRTTMVSDWLKFNKFGLKCQQW